MALTLVLSAAFALQGGSVSIRVGEKEKADSIAARRARIEASMEEVRDDSTRRRRPAIRIPLTAQHLGRAWRASGRIRRS
jgi:hypothetical protein